MHMLQKKGGATFRLKCCPANDLCCIFDLCSYAPYASVPVEALWGGRQSSYGPILRCAVVYIYFLRGLTEVQPTGKRGISKYSARRCRPLTPFFASRYDHAWWPSIPLK